MLKTIILPQRGAVRGMSDELLKWLFAVNEVLKMSVAAEQSDVPAQAFVRRVPCRVLLRTAAILIFFFFFSEPLKK